MTFCAHCGSELTTKAVPAASVSKPVISAPVARDALALEALSKKLRAIGPSFDALTEDEWGAWVDALSQPEFLEFIALGNDGIAQLLLQKEKA